MKSYGSGNQVKLPGAAPNQPNVYSFSTTYEEMYKDLTRKDRQLYPYILDVSCFNFILRVFMVYFSPQVKSARGFLCLSLFYL